jgi:hypothetical protein
VSEEELGSDLSLSLFLSFFLSLSLKTDRKQIKHILPRKRRDTIHGEYFTMRKS